MKFSHPISSVALIACISLLIGCSVTGTIRPAATSPSGFEGAVYSGETTVVNSPTPGLESFRVFNQGASSFVSLEGNREDAQNRAGEFCIQQGKRSRILQVTLSKPPHILGNFPRAEILFECVEIASATAGLNPKSDDKYSQLATLKQLLDSGAVTQAEYDLEKAKILSK